jgi:ABC-2 type transport system permease protein
MGSFISAFGFLSKEVATVLLQPRLVASLVLGPFLIMVAFGLGYRGPHPEFRTILVLPSAPAIAEQVDLSEVYREGLGGVFRLTRVMESEEAALAELRAGRADVVVAVPSDLYRQVASGQQAALKVYYTETDPTSNAWVRYFTSVQTSELNRRLMVRLLRQTKGPALQMIDYTDLVLRETDALEASVEAGDYRAAATRVDKLILASEGVSTNLGEAVDTLSGALEPDDAQPGEARDLLVEIEQQLEAFRSELLLAEVSQSRSLPRIQRIRENARRAQVIAEQISTLPIEVLVSPLTAQAENVAPVEPTPVAFYTPAVLALLLQHIGVTLASLSAVRDRLLGSLELFRISPTSAGEILVGKSLGYGLLMAVVGAALTAALMTFLEVPLLGSPYLYGLAVGLVIFGAIGLGFALSVVAQTESQAVQLAMLVLLTSVFFGGFFLPTNLLFGWVRTISYALPVTYGAINLRDLMLRGADPTWPLLAAPLLLGIAFYTVALLGLRRQMRRA